jgi:hypothetical protein
MIKNKKNKKGLSVIIGYVLLMAISIFMSILVYNWIKTYVPKDIPECSDAASITIKEVSYLCDDDLINITLKNNGRFSLDGFFIRISTNTDSSVAANIDLSQNLTGLTAQDRQNSIWGNYIKFYIQDNAFVPNAVSKNYLFNVSDYTPGSITRIEIIPLQRIQLEKQKKTATCGGARVQEQLSCQ